MEQSADILALVAEPLFAAQLRHRASSASFSHSLLTPSQDNTFDKMATMMGGSFASPSADADPLAIVTTQNGILGKILSMSGWSIALTILLLLIAYDQCEPFFSDSF